MDFKPKHMDWNTQQLRVTMHQKLVKYTAMAAISDLIIAEIGGHKNA